MKFAELRTNGEHLGPALSTLADRTTVPEYTIEP
jgi:hypothetical protein